MRGRLGIVFIGAVAAAVSTGCGSSTTIVEVPGGHAAAAPRLFAAYGCGSCHTIAGVAGANGRVGPSLSHFADRPYIAGVLPNTPDNLVRWIVDPQKIVPGTVMPDLGVEQPEARDLAAYLESH